MANFLGRPFELKSKSQVDRKAKLRHFLSLPLSSRSDGQTYEIVQLLKDNSFLMRYAGTNQLNQLVKNMRIQVYEPSEVVITEGEPGKSFYNILTGRVSVHKSEESDSKLRELMSGSYFGELSLLNSELNSCTITALESTEIMILDKEVYDNVIKSVQSQQTHNTYLFLKGLPIMAKLSEKLINYFAQAAYIRCFVPSSVIIEQEQFAGGVYFISEGTVKISRNVLFDKELNLCKKVVIDEISVGDMFCDNSFFNKCPMFYTAIAVVPVTTYYLDKAELINLDAGLLSQFRKTSKPYPDDEMLKKMYVEKKKWTSYKTNIVRAISVEKELRW